MCVELGLSIYLIKCVMSLSMKDCVSETKPGKNTFRNYRDSKLKDSFLESIDLQMSNLVSLRK